MSDLPFWAGLMLLIAFVLVVKPYSFRSCIGIGLAVSLLTLTRGVAIGLFAIIPIIWYLRKPDPGKFATSLALVAIVFALCITPWMLRNKEVFGSATLGTNLGTNLYVGNYQGAQGGSVPHVWPAFSEHIQSNEADMDRALLHNALNFVSSHPGEAARIVPRKFLNLYLLETQAVTSLFQGERPSPAVLKYFLYGLSQFTYVLLLIALSVRGFDYLSRTRRPFGPQWTGLLMASYFTLLCLAFHGEDRYRLPILPWMFIEGAVVLARAASGARPRSTV